MQARNQDVLFIDNSNSTYTPLGAGATFTGTAQEVGDKTQLIVSITTDVASTTNGISLEFGPDGVTWSTVIQQETILRTDDDLQTHGLNKVYWVPDKFFRMVYTNGGVAQDFINLQCSFVLVRDPGVQVLANDRLRRGQFGGVTRQMNSWKIDTSNFLIGNSKSKSVHAYRNGGVGATETVLANNPGTTFSFPTSAQRIRVAAGGNAQDNAGQPGARRVTVNGLDTDFKEISEIINTDGVNAGPLSTKTFVRINECIVNVVGPYGSSNIGDINIENEIDNDVLATIRAGEGKTLTSLCTIPENWYYNITRIQFTCDPDHTATFRVYTRTQANDTAAPTKPVTVYRIIPQVSGTVTITPEDLQRGDHISDVWVTAQRVTGTGNAHVSCNYDMNWWFDNTQT